MLEEKDLRAIQTMIDTSISASEGRMDDKLDKLETRMMAYFEGTIESKLSLLVDCYQDLVERMAPKSRVEALEEEVAFMKSDIKILAQEINELKKAQ